jgi:hypothetical protein
MIGDVSDDGEGGCEGDLVRWSWWYGGLLLEWVVWMGATYGEV